MINWALRRAIAMVEQDWKDNGTQIPDVIDASPRAARFVSRVTHLLAATALIVGFGLAAPAAARASDQPPAVNAYVMTPKRVVASVAAVVGLIGAVIGGVALARSGRRTDAGNRRRGAIVALVMGPIGLVMGGLVVATADGGLGTGNGLAGGFVAIVVGLIGIILGGLALARSRRIA